VADVTVAPVSAANAFDWQNRGSTTQQQDRDREDCSASIPVRTVQRCAVAWQALPREAGCALTSQYPSIKTRPQGCEGYAMRNRGSRPTAGTGTPQRVDLRHPASPRRIRNSQFERRIAQLDRAARFLIRRLLVRRPGGRSKLTRTRLTVTYSITITNDPDADSASGRSPPAT